jgi:hypothetical protein
MYANNELLAIGRWTGFKNWGVLVIDPAEVVSNKKVILNCDLRNYVYSLLNGEVRYMFVEELVGIDYLEFTGKFLYNPMNDDNIIFRLKKDQNIRGIIVPYFTFNSKRDKDKKYYILVESYKGFRKLIWYNNTDKVYKSARANTLQGALSDYFFEKVVKPGNWSTKYNINVKIDIQ